MLLLSKILIQKNKQMLLILNIQLFCFYSVLKDHIKIRKENRLFQMWLMTLIFTHKYTQFHVKDRVTSTGSVINHTVHTYIYDLVPKGAQMGGSDLWLSIKSVSNTLSYCCFVCAFIIGQYHSGNNMSSKSGAAGEIFIFESEKHHRIQPLKTDTLMVSAFSAFSTWWIETLPQSPIYIEEILLYTVPITSIIIKFWFWS